MVLAEKTKRAINEMLERDQGSLYRKTFHECMREAVDLTSDAFRADEDDFRSHLGASIIGKECPREIWYSFHWATLLKFEGRMVRLFNRGHLEEPRIVALLRSIGCTVWQYDAQKKQFRVGAHSGHFGGSLDSVIQGCPDLPNEAVLGEFKTHALKSFEKLVKDGVKEFKPNHYVQMQVYMGGYSLQNALYFAVNKNNDDIHLELVPLDREFYARYLERAGQIISSSKPPRKISQSPGWFGCKFCDQRMVCHYDVAPAINCRTCIHSHPAENGGWVCSQELRVAQYGDVIPLTKQDQLNACPDYTPFTSK